MPFNLAVSMNVARMARFSAPIGLKVSSEQIGAQLGSCGGARKEGVHLLR